MPVGPTAETGCATTDYRRSVNPLNWLCWLSHFSCLFQGICDSFFASGSSTSATFFSVAQPIKATQAANSSKKEIVRLGIRASINDSITRLHLNATRQAVSENITNSGGRFNR